MIIPNYTTHSIKPTKSADILVPVNILLDSLKYFNFSEQYFSVLRTPVQIINNFDFFDKVSAFDIDGTYRVSLFLSGYRHSVNLVPDKPLSFYK